MKAIALRCCTSVEADGKQGEDRETLRARESKVMGLGLTSDMISSSSMRVLLLFSAPIQNLPTWLLICNKNRHIHKKTNRFY